jgi:hypothetical protein
MGITTDRFGLTTSVWDDVVISGTAINPVGLPSPATLDTSDGAWLFASGSDNVAIFIFQIPHRINEALTATTDFNFHIHWCKTTSAAGTVKWQAKFDWANIGATFGGYGALADGTAVVSDSNTANKHALIQWPLDPTGKTVSSILKVYLQRTSAGGGDTYAADAKLLSADCHFRIDSMGSDSETSKSWPS